MAVFSPRDQLNISDVQHTVKIKEEPPEDQSPGVDQQDPQPLHIKEEEEELWTSLEREQLNVIVVFPLKSEDEEEKPLFELHQHQMDDREGPSSSSADQMKAEADGEDCGGADLNPHGDTSSSSETEVSEDYEKDENVNHPDSHLKPFSDSGSTTEDSDDYWKESRAPESGGNSDNRLFSCEECETPKYCLCFNPTPHYEAICSPPHSPPPKHKSNGNCSNRSQRGQTVSTATVSNNCPLCMANLLHVSKHLRATHDVKNKVERQILINLANGHTNIRGCPCPIVGCRYVPGKHLDRHIYKSHTELTAPAQERMVQHAKRVRAMQLLSNLRATDPTPPMVTKLDLEAAEVEQPPPLPEPTCSTPACRKLFERINQTTFELQTKNAQLKKRVWDLQCALATSKRMIAAKKNPSVPHAPVLRPNTRRRKCVEEEEEEEEAAGTSSGDQATANHKEGSSHCLPAAPPPPSRRHRECEVCGRRFSQKTTLNRHVKVHTGQKDHVCEDCGRKFNTKQNLKMHMKIHTQRKSLAVNSEA